jgi:hypothetical protein
LGYQSSGENLETIVRPVAHGPDVPIPTPPETLDTSPPDSEYHVGDCDDVEFSLQNLVSLSFLHKLNSKI